MGNGMRGMQGTRGMFNRIPGILLEDSGESLAHGNGNTCISEERLTVLMKKIFAEELEKQQQGLLKLISGNFEITMKEIKNIKIEMNELKKSIEFTEEVLEEKVQIMHRKVSSLEEKVEEIYDYQIDPDEVQKKLTDLEDRSRRNNLLIDGVEEENGESWDDCERKVKEIFMKKLELENDIIIERAHRAGKSKYGKKDQPRTIVCKLLSYKDKVKVLQYCKKLKGSHIYINEDFCQATLQYRKELWKEVKRLREEEDKIAYLQYLSIVVKDKNNVR